MQTVKNKTKSKSHAIILNFNFIKNNECIEEIKINTKPK